MRPLVCPGYFAHQKRPALPRIQGPSTAPMGLLASDEFWHVESSRRWSRSRLWESDHARLPAFSSCDAGHRSNEAADVTPQNRALFSRFSNRHRRLHHRFERGGAAQAKVKRIVFDAKVSPATNCPRAVLRARTKPSGARLRRARSNDPHNAIITDIRPAPKNANGKVEYMATFFLVKPIDMSKSSHLMWQFVPNRGGRITLEHLEQSMGDIGLTSGWQGDNIGFTAQNFPNTNHYAVVPVAKNLTVRLSPGKVIGRIVNATVRIRGRCSAVRVPCRRNQRISNTAKATIITHVSETIDGVVSGGSRSPAGTWPGRVAARGTPFPALLIRPRFASKTASTQS